MASIRILGTRVNTLAKKWLADCTGLYVPLYCSGVQFSGGLTVSMTLVARQRCELGACHEWGMSTEQGSQDQALHWLLLKSVHRDRSSSHSATVPEVG